MEEEPIRVRTEDFSEVEEYEENASALAAIECMLRGFGIHVDGSTGSIIAGVAALGRRSEMQVIELFAASMGAKTAPRTISMYAEEVLKKNEAEDDARIGIFR